MAADWPPPSSCTSLVVPLARLTHPLTRTPHTHFALARFASIAHPPLCALGVCPVGLTLQTDVVQGARSALRTAYCPLWDELADANVQARRKLAPTVATVLLEAKNAVRRLVEGGGSSSASAAADGGEEGSDGEDLVDVTHAQHQAKRARREAETITIDDDDAIDPADTMTTENEPLQAAAAAPAVAPTKAKVER